MRPALWLSVLFSVILIGACDDEEQAREEERARNLAILANLASAEQAGGSAKVAFRNEYNPGSCPAWLVNINKNGSAKSVISATETGQTSATVNVPAPDLYDMDIRCANGSGNVNVAGQAVENGRSYLLHYKSDGNISFAEFSL